MAAVLVLAHREAQTLAQVEAAVVQVHRVAATAAPASSLFE